MSEMNNEFEQLLEESLVTIHNGEIVEGTVISVKEDEIILNIGYKADGIITRNEYSNQSGIDLREVVKEGYKSAGLPSMNFSIRSFTRLPKLRNAL